MKKGEEQRHINLFQLENGFASISDYNTTMDVKRAMRR